MPTRKIVSRMTFVPTSTTQVVARGTLSFLALGMLQVLTMSVIRTAVPLTTLLSMTLPLVLQMAAARPIQAMACPSQVVSPHVDRTMVGTAEPFPY
jgi:hypothetical protein